MIKEDFSLKTYNTLQLDIKTRYYAAPKTIEDTISILKSDLAKNTPLFILGGGSNILFRADFDGLVIHPSFSSINIINEDENTVLVEVGAGVEWDNFVEWAVENNYFGIENLSLIPGNTGASPVQNIGAYGVEVKDVIKSVKGINLDSLETFKLNNEACEFGYRNSVFKNKLKDKTLITSVIFELNKDGELLLNYGSIKSDVEALGAQNLSNTRKAIIKVRNSKLPDPKEFGNAGSFFKNPVVPNSIAKLILEKYPNAPSYPAGDNFTKIPAGWLIEQTGWKGKSLGNAAVHKDQALVLINLTGEASGKEILKLANSIVSDVHSRFGIRLEKEVNIK